jgi:outer membrane protein assembly factor BamA
MWALAAVLHALPALGAGEEADLYDEVEASAYLGRPVTAIRFEPPMADVEDPFRFFDVVPGEPISHELVWLVIQRMWLTGKVAHVAVLADDLPDGTVQLAVRYDFRLRLQEVSVKGNKKIKKKKILELIAFRPDMEIFPGTIESFEMALQEEYALRGFPDASFLIDVVPLEEPDEVELDITVIEGVPYRIRDIAVEYVGDDPLEGPVPVFELAKTLGLADGDIYDQIRLERGLRAIEGKLQDAGHLNAKAGPAEPETDEAGKLHLRIPVDPGPLVRFVIVGNDHLPDGHVLEVMDPKRVLPLNAGLVEEMALRLAEHYRLLGFLDASVLAQQKIDEKRNLVIYRFTVQEGPRVKVEGIRFEGNEHFKDKVLRKQVLSFLYEQVPYDVVFGGLGFDVVDDLLLSEGKGDGVEKEPPTVSLALWPPEWIYWTEAYEDAIDHIAKMYISEGYLNAKVSPPAVKREGDALVVTIVIKEGVRTFVERVAYEGNAALEDQLLASVTGVDAGKPFSGLGVKDAEDAILDAYGDRGYRFATVETLVDFTEDATGASVTYRIVEGPQVTIRKILVRGNAQTTRSLILDRISLKTGGIFSLKKEKQSVSRLHKLGIFRSVSIQMLEPTIAEPEKTIVVEVVERKPQYLSLAGGASTAEGVRGSIEYAYRNLFGYAIDFHFRVALNYRLFFVGVTPEFRDWYLSMPLIDQLERNVGVGLTLPHLPRVGNWMTVELSFAHLRKNSNIYGITTNSMGGSILLGPGKKFNLTLQSGVESSFIEANTEITEDLLSLPLCGAGETKNCLTPAARRTLRVPQTDNPAAFVVTTGRLSLDFRDNPFNPTKGVSINAALSWIISPRLVDYTWYEPVTVNGERVPQGPYRTGHYWKDVHHEKAMSNLLKIYADVTGYVALGTPRVVLMLHAGGGIIVPLPGHTHTFPDRLFYLGGSRSLRGVAEEGLCAEDEYRDRSQCFLGGELMMIYKAELRVMLRGNLGLAFFVDTGNLWHGWDDRYGTNGLGRWYNIFADLRATSGVGVRYITPVGPLNFDVGFLLNRHEDVGDPIGQFHFSIGTF